MKPNIYKFELKGYLCYRDCVLYDGYKRYKLTATKPKFFEEERFKFETLYGFENVGEMVRRDMTSGKDVMVSDVVNYINTKLGTKLTFEDIIFFDRGKIDRNNLGYSYVKDKNVAMAPNEVYPKGHIYSYFFSNRFFVLKKDLIPVELTKGEQEKFNARNKAINAAEDKKVFMQKFLGPSLQEIADKYDGKYLESKNVIRTGCITARSYEAQCFIVGCIKNSLGKDLENIGIIIPENYNPFDRYGNYNGDINLNKFELNIDNGGEHA